MEEVFGELIFSILVAVVTGNPAVVPVAMALINSPYGG